MERKAVVTAIQNIILNIKEECIIQNTAIRDSIFGILENACTVIYYPFEKEKNRGFHIKKVVKNKLEDFVYINTAKPIAEQIFAAAHEFGHIWGVAEKVWYVLGYEGKPTEKEEEDITDWFAAELLMPTETFRNTFLAHMNKLGIKAGMVKLDDLVRVIVLQMNDFMVPYESVRRRLTETSIIQQEAADYLLSKEEEILNLVAVFTKDSNTYIGNGTGAKTVSGIRTLIENAENQEKVDKYLLNKIKREFNIEGTSVAEKSFEIHVGDNHDK
ncbi:MAG: ImmA/IrrE family metallo-endopeptidase [Lachnospiraceae bacterium]|jgi:Zn-dependent peptidase ImmA (M78 family)|nr:ImmA/IrrE family metallo-endopeptidase [Lachnospiraceae bacterium]